jgi:hypothetical protein
MALDPSALESQLASVFDSILNSNGTADDAGTALASVYANYAGGATFGASTPVLTSQQSALAGALKLSLALPGLAATHAAAWAAGLTAFWVAVPVVGAQSGATVACPGAASLTATLTALYANLANTAATCAAGLAAALHTATLTVTAVVSPPPATVLPIA